MSGNEAFEMVSERGWVRGWNSMLRSALARWFRTRTWWVQCLIWGGLMGGLISAIAFVPNSPPATELLMIFAIFVGLFPAVGVIIIMQDALVGEKREGTAAWVLSKPVTRPVFVLSKVAANSIGMLATMVIVPSIIGYAVIYIAKKSALDPTGLFVAMGLIFINHFFYLSLTLMLGAFFNSRGPVIGIPLAILLLQQNIIGIWPILRFVLPWNLIIPPGDTPSLLVSLMLKAPIQSEHLITLAFIVTESLLFVLIGLWRFNREEF
jgi:ABC-type transport system involved in multi-copper enzyme maturation permease subunit